MGELAALLTSVMWSLTSVQFTLAGRELGSENVNRLRLVIAAVLLALAHLARFGSLLPADAGWGRWGWLGVSGFVGLVLGDSALFRSFLVIGPRQAMLLMTMVPIFGALLAWLWLGETLALAEISAVAVTVGGIAWVVAERARPGNTPGWPELSPRARLTGVLLGLAGAMGQAGGLVLAKQGLSGDYPPLSATVIRMVVGAVAIWVIAALRRKVSETVDAVKHGRNRRYVVGGAVTGPTVGVWLSMVAVAHAPVGIAATLMALPPIILIPLARWIFGEQITRRAVAGTVVALAGAAALYMIE
jgi:drug/metabolite transporter (DMT)-like permease